jgi:aspartate oxidase
MAEYGLEIINGSNVVQIGVDDSITQVMYSAYVEANTQGSITLSFREGDDSSNYTAIALYAGSGNTVSASTDMIIGGQIAHQVSLVGNALTYSLNTSIEFTLEPGTIMEPSLNFTTGPSLIMVVRNG